MTRRTGRLSVRMTPEFIELCAKTAQDRGLTLTEYVQQSMALNLTREVTQLEERKTQIINAVLNNG